MHRKIAPHRPPCRLYGPPYNSNTNGFFKELNKSLSNITRKYENVLAVGDLNINLLDQKKKKKKKKVCLTSCFLRLPNIFF